MFGAIDLAGGKAVRLLRGERAAARVVAEDPLGLALHLAAEGAPFLHLVDLDAAFGDGDNGRIVTAILGAVGCPVQVGGGVRDRSRFARLREAGASRVVLGTAALRDPELLAWSLDEARDGVVVAADGRGGRVAASGWREDGGVAVGEFARRMRAAGVAHLLVTAVERDGTGDGPDHAVLREALAEFGPGVIASGGVGSVDDVRDLAPLARRGLAGVVVGSLLVDGKANVGDLVEVTAGWETAS